MRPIFPLVALLLSVAASGCANTCDRMCDAQAELMERCFASWDTSWQGESYSDKDEFLGRCYALWGDELDSLESDSAEYADFDNRCERQLQVAISDVDCESPLLIEP